jgi:hypothetical protein
MDLFTIALCLRDPLDGNNLQPGRVQGCAVPLMEGRQISIKEKKVSILFKFVFILSRKLSCK